MARNPSGTYSLPVGNPVVAGTTIEASWANTTLSDIGTEITNSLARTGAGGMTGPLRLSNGSSTIPGLAWGDETGTGFYRPGTADTRFVVQTAEIQKWVASGSTVTGTFGMSGDFAVATNKFTVAAATGNTAVAGTFDVAGAVTLSAGTANGVAYLNGSKVLTSGSALTFSGTNLGIGIASAAARLDVTGAVNSLQARFGNIASRGLEVSTSVINGTNDAGSVLNARGAGDGTLVVQLDSSEKARFNGSNFILGTTSTGADGLGISNLLNLTFPEGSGVSYTNLFRQTSSAATIIANGYKRSATASGFASSTGASWAKTAIGLGVNTGAISFYADSATTVANGTDATPTERVRMKPTGQVRFVPLASAPGSAEAGDVYYDSGTNKLRCYNGTTWNDLF